MKILIIDTKNKIMIIKSGFFFKKTSLVYDFDEETMKRKIEYYSYKNFNISFDDLSEFYTNEIKDAINLNKERIKRWI